MHIMLISQFGCYDLFTILIGIICIASRHEFITMNKCLHAHMSPQCIPSGLTVDITAPGHTMVHAGNP